MKMCPKIILEGTRLTHKTDIAFALNEHPRVVGPRKYRYHSPLISGEWCTFTNFPWGRGLINFSADEESLAMETYETWVRLLELQRYYSWVIDRFHVSTLVYQAREHSRYYDLSWLEDRLAAIGFRGVLCTRRPESFPAAREERITVSGNPSQYDDLSPFVREQEEMRKAVGHSRLPWIEIDVSDNDVTAACDRIADWLEESGGLCQLLARLPVTPSFAAASYRVHAQRVHIAVNQLVKKSNMLPSALVDAWYSSVYLHRMQVTVLNFLFCTSKIFANPPPVAAN